MYVQVGGRTVSGGPFSYEGERGGVMVVPLRDEIGRQNTGKVVGKSYPERDRVILTFP